MDHGRVLGLSFRASVWLKLFPGRNIEQLELTCATALEQRKMQTPKKHPKTSVFSERALRVPFQLLLITMDLALSVNAREQITLDHDEIAAANSILAVAPPLKKTQFVPHVAGVHSSSTLREDKNRAGESESWRAAEEFLAGLEPRKSRAEGIPRAVNAVCILVAVVSEATAPSSYATLHQKVSDI
jgi:hypothetical protein